MKDRGYPIVTVTKKAENSLTKGHPWVYDTEIAAEDRAYNDGDIVNVVNAKGKYLGTAFINRNSKIRLRIFCRNANETPDEAFWKRRVRQSLALRKTVIGEQFSACRLIFGEADYFPGLTVDRFDNVLVAQTLSLGTEKVKHIIFAALLEELSAMGENVTAIYERNDVKIRELEGMEQYKGWYTENGIEAGNSTEVIITENGIRYYVDIENGQKTGYFLDQKFNRADIGALAKDKKVLDCFTHTGSFALNAAKGGALSVTAVDISEEAIEQARRNAELNGLEGNMDFVCENVFDLLSNMKPNGDYDFIILDPPAFTKSRATLNNAIKGYKEINLRAMKLLPKGGILATCSCSHFMTDEHFREMLRSAAADAGVQLRQLKASQQAPDHPIMWNVPETDYLKFYIFQIA